MENKKITKDVPKQIIRVNNGRSCLRLLSRVIMQYQKNEIDETYSKCLCYLLTSYIQAYKAVELEARVEELEGIIENKHCGGCNAA